MWLLILVLLLPGGGYQVAHNPEPDKYQCLVDLQQITHTPGVSVAGECAEVKGA